MPAARPAPPALTCLFTGLPDRELLQAEKLALLCALHVLTAFTVPFAGYDDEEYDEGDDPLAGLEADGTFGGALGAMLGSLIGGGHAGRYGRGAQAKRSQGEPSAQQGCLCHGHDLASLGHAWRRWPALPQLADLGSQRCSSSLQGWATVGACRTAAAAPTERASSWRMRHGGSSGWTRLPPSCSNSCLSACRAGQVRRRAALGVPAMSLKRLAMRLMLHRLLPHRALCCKQRG